MKYDRTIIVGDTHGCRDEFKALVETVGLTHRDLLILAGDLLDKGPDGPGLVQDVRALVEAGQPFLGVMGNHDHANIRFARNARGKATGEKAENAERLTEKDLQFLESFTLWVRVPDHDALVVHGGLLPSWDNLPSEEELAAMDKKTLSKWERVMRVRHVLGKDICKVTVELEFPFEVTHLAEALADGSYSGFEEVKRSLHQKGSFVSLGQEREGIDPFWADVYDGKFGHVFFGHSPYKDADAPVTFPHATALDLGCVYGNKLAAAVLDADGISHLTVDAKQVYSADFKDC